jgi:hypothetical protein
MKSRFFRTVALVAALVCAYIRLIRPRVLNWGATEAEAVASLPGDGILPDAAIQTTRAITIDTDAPTIWKWLVQMGPRPRAGVYTYDWLEQLLGLDIENSDRIMPEHQHMDVGDKWSLKPGGGPVLDVMQVEEASHIVLQWEPAAATWAFVLQPQGGSTRLISRNRIPGSGLAFRVIYAFMEPASLVMEREMLLGIKRRAEGLQT